MSTDIGQASEPVHYTVRHASGRPDNLIKLDVSRKMKKRPFCAEDIQEAAIVAPAAVLPGRNAPLPRQQVIALLLIAFGLFAALTKQPAPALGGGVLSWVGFALLMKGNGGVSIGGGFVVALLLMTVGISCG